MSNYIIKCKTSKIQTDMKMESHECNMFNGLQTKKTPLCNHNEILNLEDVCYTIVVNLDV